METVKRWTGLVADAIHAFRPGWHWTEISRSGCQKDPGFEKDVLQLGDEDWFLGMVLRPSGWQMGVIHDRKVICSTHSGQFKVLFGIWSRMWAGKVMLSRMQWERRYDWSPGKKIVVSMGPVNFGPGGPYDNWRSTLAKRNAEWYALRDKLEQEKLNPAPIVFAALPDGKTMLSAKIEAGSQWALRVPAQFRPYLTLGGVCSEMNTTDKSK